MKKIVLLAASVGLFFASCQKDDMSNPGTSESFKTTASSPAPILPAAFVKKVLVEEFTGTSYAQVPEASRDLYMIVQAGKDRVYSAGMHVGDVMNTVMTGYVLNAMNNSNPAIPCGLVNRQPLNGNLFLDSKHFATAIGNQLIQPVSCGLSINSTLNTTRSSLTVSVGFTASMNGSYRVVTYLTEDKVINYSPLYYQQNGFNNTPGSPYYNVGNPIHGFEYYNVIRKTLSATNGDVIPQNALTAGNVISFPYQIDLPRKLSSTPDNFMIVAFVIDANTDEIVNVQQCALGAKKGWN